MWEAKQLKKLPEPLTTLTGVGFPIIFSVSSPQAALLETINTGVRETSRNDIKELNWGERKIEDAHFSDNIGPGQVLMNGYFITSPVLNYELICLTPNLFIPHGLCEINWVITMRDKVLIENNLVLYFLMRWNPLCNYHLFDQMSIINILEFVFIWTDILMVFKPLNI